MPAPHPAAATALETPVCTVDLAAVTHNLATVGAWTRDRGVLLAPHGKTTMTPAIWRRQLDAGAWGITVANAQQLGVAIAAGVPRVVVANELLSPAGLRAAVAAIAGGRTVVCWVDSVDGVDLVTAALADAPDAPPLDVCVEWGGGAVRAGVRTREQALAVADAVLRSPALRLVGVASFEGAVRQADEAGVRAHLRELGDLGRALAGRFETDEPLLTAGGSAWFDLVVDELSAAAADVPGARVLLRSGATVVHDDGLYRAGTPRAARGSGPELIAATHVWARVLSTPEPGLAVLDAGRRDASFDAGLPEPQLVVGRDGAVRPADGLVTTALNDQHAMVAGDGLRVGEIVRFGISHPCTTFDKWREVLLVERADVWPPRVVEVAPTAFS